MKLEVIDYLPTAGRPKSKASTVESEGEKKEIDFLFVPPRGAPDKAVTHQTADLSLTVSTHALNLTPIRKCQ